MEGVLFIFLCLDWKGNGTVGKLKPIFLLIQLNSWTQKKTMFFYIIAFRFIFVNQTRERKHFPFFFLP